MLHLVEHECELFVPLLFFGNALLVVLHLCVHAAELLLLVTGEAEKKRGQRGGGRGGGGKERGGRVGRGMRERGRMLMYCSKIILPTMWHILTFVTYPNLTAVSMAAYASSLLFIPIRVLVHC